ncbi:hypothetical protein ACNUDN_27970 [Mycobacterium sp. smrl_JER01]|uniref:hypothetical protein n=1 Tax=Mycobacterium sp. smrl_JER01 TaxID=3402633 RepID=UPI003AC73744
MKFSRGASPTQAFRAINPRGLLVGGRAEDPGGVDPAFDGEDTFGVGTVGMLNLLEVVAGQQIWIPTRYGDRAQRAVHFVDPVRIGATELVSG